jgi:hypothetical protein
VCQKLRAYWVNETATNARIKGHDEERAPEMEKTQQTAPACPPVGLLQVHIRAPGLRQGRSEFRPD